MKQRSAILFCLCLLLSVTASAQFGGGLDNPLDNGGFNGTHTDNGHRHTSWGRDTSNVEVEIPIGQFVWKLDERLGTVIPAEPDTLQHSFQNSNLTSGLNGEYNFLGNLGSPRLSRIFFHRDPSDQFLFLQPFDFFYTTPSNFLFTNTLSPITNLSYHSCGSKETGEDRLRAYFATNINKRAGIGFKLDYLYGRGYYNYQANSMFNSTLYGYYRGERYQLHALTSLNHMKMAENGGIEDATYITNPEAIGQSFTSKDIPTVLASMWNRNDDQTFYLTHRYNLGFYRDAEGADSLRNDIPSDEELLLSLKDSVRAVVMAADTLRRLAVVDSLRQDYVANMDIPQDFVPVTSFIHTLKIRSLRHSHYAYETVPGYYTNHYYGNPESLRDRTRAQSFKNTFGIALREGFNKWAKAGLTAFASHEHRRFSLPGLDAEGLTMRDVYHENNLSVGGELSKTQGRTVHYNINGEAVIAGEDVGQFELDGKADLNLRLLKDTVSLLAHAYVKHLNPSFYYRHYHSQNTWWDNNLSKELRTRIEGTLRIGHTRTALNVGVENITNYTYFATEKTLHQAENGAQSYSRNIAVRQNSGSLQVFSATLKQDFKWGILNWENEATYQKSSDQGVLPLPDLSVYSNLYIKFRIARVLSVEFGGDVRYFTGYWAPDYAPAIGQFTVQDKQTRYKLGNYPVCNVYANMHLKHCRFYVSANHVNASDGYYFLAPNYPLNPMTLNFGLSWNFFN